MRGMKEAARAWRKLAEEWRIYAAERLLLLALKILPRGRGESEDFARAILWYARAAQERAKRNGNPEQKTTTSQVTIDKAHQVE